MQSTKSVGDIGQPCLTPEWRVMERVEFVANFELVFIVVIAELGCSYEVGRDSDVR